MKNAAFLTMFFLVPVFLLAQQPTLLWKFPTKGQVIGSPVCDGEHIYAGSTDSCLYAIDKKTGNEKWRFHTGGPVRSDALLTGNAVYVYSGNGKLFKLNRNGEVVWQSGSVPEKQVDPWDYYHSSPVAAGASVVIGLGNGEVHALDTASGKLSWNFVTGAAVHASPVVAGNILYACSYDGYLYALDTVSGKLLWKFKTVGDRYFPEGSIQKSVAIYKDAAIFGSRDFNIYAVDALKGTGLWNWKEKGSWIIASPLVWQDNLYFGTSDSHTFYCTDAGSGEVKWKLALPMRVYGSAIAHDSLVYFGCFDGKLYGVHYRTGKILRKFQTDGSRKNYSQVFDASGHFKKGFVLYGPDMDSTEKAILNLGSIMGAPLATDRRIYFGSTDGYIYALSL